MNFDESTVNKIKRLEREVERLKVNSEKALPDGWIPVSSTWTYASATTITVPSGAAAIYKVGQGFRLTANGVVKQGYIVSVADTLLTTAGDALTDHTFSAISYTNTPSTAIGFPVVFAWTPSVTGATVGNGTVVATFSIIGKVLFLSFSFTLGSTSSVSAYVHFTAPAPISALLACNSGVVDSGVGWYVGAEEIIGQEIYLGVPTANATYLAVVGFTSTVPFTWTTADNMWLSGAFRLA